MTTRSLALRAGDARDIVAVDRLMASAFDPRFGEAWTRNQCLGVLAMPGVRLTLALADEMPAGFALTRSVIDEAELLLLAVDPTCRRRGIGGALLHAVIGDCRDGGATRLHLEVRAGNGAISLYNQAGFTKAGERRAYYRGRGGQLFDAHSYHLELAERETLSVSAART